MRPLFVLFVLALAFATPARAGGPPGVITRPSHHGVAETLDRLEAALKKKGITIALRWNHAAKARAAGIPLRPTELLVFGNPRLGSHLFTSRQTAGLDLPMKVLAWEDENGKVWLSYNDPGHIAARHGITDRDPVVAKMRAALDRLTSAAAAP